IYKMDYAAMLKAHIEKNADATIAVYEVPWDEAPRFGILNTKEDDVIEEFEEKPANPKSNLASMGVYIFTWSVLRQALIEDEANPNSNNDFGKNIVPNLLAQGKKLCAYRFSGYWKDVGTISSLWETNMDILDKPEEINLVDRSWKIFSRNPVKPSHFIGSGAKVKNSALTDGCRIFGDVEHSVLSESVIVEKGAIVKDCVLMPGVVVKEGAHLERCVIDQGTVIGKNVQAGSFVEGEGPYTNHKICSEGICVFERGLTIKEGAVIPKNSMIDSDLEVPEDCKIIESKFRA
ncbi:MAG: glucose-1-phosphate adenylyltransferase, partial [Lachnospiraceae bacterium]|nr:glucose-1-phosphate adenylyltransferase [Lachnospiraceae bacterium]